MKKSSHTPISSRRKLTHTVANYVRNYPGRSVVGEAFIESQIETKFGAPLKSLPEELLEQAIALVEEYFQKLRKLSEITRIQSLQIPKYI